MSKDAMTDAIDVGAFQPLPHNHLLALEQRIAILEANKDDLRGIVNSLVGFSEKLEARIAALEGRVRQDRS